MTRAIRLEEYAVLSLAALGVLACYTTGTGFSFWSVFVEYARFFAIAWMLVFMGTHIVWAVERHALPDRSRLSRYSGTDAIVAANLELARGGLLLFTAMTVYTNVKVRVPLIHGLVTDPVLTQLDETLLLGGSFAWLAQVVHANPILDAFLETIYLQDFWVVALAALLLHLAGDARGLRTLLAASALLYLAGIAWTVALPSYGPFFVDAASWNWVQAHSMGAYQRTLVQGLGRTMEAGRLGSELRVAAGGGIAACPSLHVAHLSLVALLARRSRDVRWFAWVAALVTLATTVATLAYGWHYFVDALAGVLLAGLTLAAVRRLIAADEARTTARLVAP